MLGFSCGWGYEQIYGAINFMFPILAIINKIMGLVHLKTIIKNIYG